MNRTIAAAVVSGIIALACGRAALASASAPTPCEQLAAVKLENTTIASAERVTGGVFTPPTVRDSLTNLPPFCRVTGEIRPTSDSQIAFELWMPLEKRAISRRRALRRSIALVVYRRPSAASSTTLRFARAMLPTVSPTA